MLSFTQLLLPETPSTESASGVGIDFKIYSMSFLSVHLKINVCVSVLRPGLTVSLQLSRSDHQPDQGHRDQPAFGSQVLALKTCTAMPGKYFKLQCKLEYSRIKTRE